MHASVFDKQKGTFKQKPQKRFEPDRENLTLLACQIRKNNNSRVHRDSKQNFRTETKTHVQALCRTTKTHD